MITKLYIGRVGRYYPETRYYDHGSDVRAVVATPFTEYDFADEADVPADGDWIDPDGAYRPEVAEPEPELTPMEERQAAKEALADQAQPAAPELADEPPPADPPASAVRSSQAAGAPKSASTAPATAGQEG